MYFFLDIPSTLRILIFHFRIILNSESHARANSSRIHKTVGSPIKVAIFQLSNLKRNFQFAVQMAQ